MNKPCNNKLFNNMVPHLYQMLLSVKFSFQTWSFVEIYVSICKYLFHRHIVTFYFNHPKWSGTPLQSYQKSEITFRKTTFFGNRKNSAIKKPSCHIVWQRSDKMERFLQNLERGKYWKVMTYASLLFPIFCWLINQIDVCLESSSGLILYVV